MTLARHSEPYAATGNIGDGGFRRLLGAPSIEVLQLVVREALQNSCDAAQLKRGPEVTIRLRRLGELEMEILRKRVLADLPLIDASRAALEAFLRSSEPRVLEIADFRTTGLGGPTRADRMPVGTWRTDFIDFFRNVGTRRGTQQGGGTYGFGKASLYMASRCSTILVDTLTSGEESDRRFMGCHLGVSGERTTGDGYVEKYTGRHWWGVPDAGLVGPATGKLAEELAAALGFPVRSDGDTGTTIVILDPDLGNIEVIGDASEEADDDSELPDAASTRLQVAAEHIAGSVLWNFWPRMMASTPNERRLRARVFLDGAEIEVPPPEEAPPLDHYCAALDRIRRGAGDVLPVRTHGRTVGRLATMRGLRSPRTPPFDGKSTPFAPAAAGIALMRPAEFVVTIVPGAALPDEKLEWAGVFVASDEADIEQAFAHSEPAAHDNWDPHTLTDPAEKRWVSGALRKIRQCAAEVAAQDTGAPLSGGDSGRLAKVAEQLGQFLRRTGHDGPQRGGGGGGNGGGTRRRVSAPVFSRLQRVDGEVVAEFRLALSGRGPQDELILTPAFAVEGAIMPLDESGGATLPRILGVHDADGQLLEGTRRVRVGDREGDVSVLVTVPQDCAVTLTALLVKSR